MLMLSVKQSAAYCNWEGIKTIPYHIITAELEIICSRPLIIWLKLVFG